MAIRCWIVANGTSIYPELPVEREPMLIEDSRRQLNGTLRTAHRAEKVRMRYQLSDATEAEVTAWLAAHPRNASFSVTDERNVTRTMKVTRFPYPLTRTAPDTEGGAATNGDGFYFLEVEMEEV
jgi:hypothetical protein